MTEHCPTCGQQMPEQPVRMTEEVEFDIQPPALGEALISGLRGAVRERFRGDFDA